MPVPNVTIGYAQSLDGRLATATGDSQWISCPESLTMTHELRRDHDAILVGVGTVLTDDPELTVRRVPGRSPPRVIVDSRLRTPLDSVVVTTAAAVPTLVVTRRGTESGREPLESAGVEVIGVDSDDSGSRVDLPSLLAALGDRGITSVFVEGGRLVLTAMLRASLADRVVVTVAPFFVGTGVDAIGDLGIRRLADAPRPDEVEIRRVGVDTVFDIRFHRRRGES